MNSERAVFGPLRSKPVLLLIFTTLAAANMVGCSGPDKVPDGVTTIKSSSGNQLRPYTEHTLSNGLRVILVRDDGLPSVSYHMIVKTGASQDPVNQSGLALLVSSTLEKGTQKKNATQLAEELAIIGGSFGTSVDQDFVMLQASGLSTYRNQLLELFLEITTKPSFSNLEIERNRKQILADLTQQIDDPSKLSERAFDEFLFGSHPYSRSVMGKKRDVANIKKALMIRYYLQNYRPNNAIMAVVGNYSTNVLVELESALKGWKPRPSKPGQTETISAVAKTEFRLIHKADLSQAQIRLGQEGLKRNHPDYLALRLANVILGQGFSSRLVDEIRDNLGLTYHISSEVDSRLLGGAIEIKTFTRNEKVGEAVKKIQSILTTFAIEGVKEDEIQAAKGFLIGGFGRSLETAEKLAYNLLALRAYNVPDSYLTEFIETVDAFTVAGVNKVIRTYFHPERMKLLVLANQNQVFSQLSQWQPVDVKQAAEIQ